MWRACRAAAVCHLRAARMPVYRAPLQCLEGVRFYFTSIAGVDRDVLFNCSARDLRAEIGNAKIGLVAKALEGELNDAISREDVTSEEIIDVFMAAQKTRATHVMLTAFAFLEARYPSHINFAVYGEVFRILQRRNESKRLIEIYTTAKPRFKAVPEMIYRFGIVGYLQIDDMDTAVKIWQEMTDAGHETTNEITSRLMLAFAKKGNVEKVQELYDAVDPQLGYWHESCIDRVILSMGIIERPEKAFEFYSNSSMKLSGGTLIALLSVCRANNCKQQATDILANRKKFDLYLDARGYNRIMTTLEFLERNDEIKDVLKEMVDNNVRFDTKTNQIIMRNAEFLQDTSFAVNPNRSKMEDSTLSQRIRELFAQGNDIDAAALVDSAVKLLEKSEDDQSEIPEGAMIVRPSLAKDAVQAYIQTNQHDKVAALVKGFSVVRGKYGYALAGVITHYVKQKNETRDDIIYAASKAMLFQEVPIYRVNDTLKLFRRFRDPNAALVLFDQILASYSSKNAKEDDGVEKSTYFLYFNIGKVINLVLQTLVENGKVVDALEILNKIASCNLQATEANYIIILSSMRKHLRRSYSHNKSQSAMYDISNVQTVLEDLRYRGLKVNRAIVGYLCPAYIDANKQQRLELLEAFAEAQNDRNDSYKLPCICYDLLLKFMALEGNMTELQTLYGEAVVSVSDEKDRAILRGWMTILVSRLVSEGNIIEAEQLILQMPEKCGGHTYKAVLCVLRGALKAQNSDIIDSMMELIKKCNFIVKLSEAYELVHLARNMNNSQRALEFISLFEKDNLKELTPSGDGKGNLEAVFYRRQRRDAHALQKVKTMYTIALKMCEKDGLWKHVLELRDRMTMLLGHEAIDEITENSNELSSKRMRKPSFYKE
ncbi:uncharacterized protein PHALS_08705 [Plasmopara halstedii]|uniref:Uncharacterized protein n=1 Tax=Plasmopara halstedii TaxID=4781 RepID=A0A0P1ACF8_PLAHL|nr:uncharacterized protein PHALS_08705 [Plasmopara halstedii]CEG38644.1 hypothetical protein PHALS_08705 [Plasmopara halstedii]|eukprot:XP_024575013.1 hypothetical protein PHALS_08705 [Plasmopara halstedii]